MPPQNSCPVQQLQSYLAIRSFASIQASGATISNEQQARKMLTAVTNTAGGFDYSGEYYTLCCTFLAGTDSSMPYKGMVHPNDQSIDALKSVRHRLRVQLKYTRPGRYS